MKSLAIIVGPQMAPMTPCHTTVMIPAETKMKLA
jgi:hypothetical protein